MQHKTNQLDSQLGSTVGSMIRTDQVLETEVGLEGEVMVEVGVRDLVAVENHSLSGHELKHPLHQQPHQQLLQKRHHHAALGGQIKLPPIFLGTRGFVKEVEGVGHSMHCIIMCERVQKSLVLGVALDELEQVIGICLKLSHR